MALQTKQSRRLSPQQIVAHVSAELRSALPSHDVAPAPDAPGQVRLIERASGCEAARLDLGNLLAELFGQPLDPVQMDERISDFVDMARNALAAPKLDPNGIYPALRHSEFIDVYGGGAFVRPGPGDCSVIVMQDAGPHVATVSRDLADVAALTEEAVWEQAERNLAKAMKEVQICESGPGIYSLWLEGLDWMGNTLLMVPELLTDAMDEIGFETALISAPSRESVEILDANDPQALRKLGFWMRETLAGPHPQSQFVYALGGALRKPAPRYFCEGGALRAMN